jgi:hypothetical protein
VDIDNLFILIIVFSFVARAIGEAMKAGKKGPAQHLPGQRPQRPGLPQQRPGLPQQRPELPQQRSERQEPQARFPVERAPAEAPAQKQSSEELAAEMIPDELWRILTGQPKPRPSPPPPARAPSEAWTGEADVDEELGYEEAEAAWEATDLTREDREAQELLERRAEVARDHERTPETYQPAVVSMETEPATTPVRHAAFHQKIDQPQVLPGIRRRTAPSIGRIVGAGPHALRRAVLLQEILGKPKGLE